MEPLLADADHRSPDFSAPESPAAGKSGKAAVYHRNGKPPAATPFSSSPKQSPSQGFVITVHCINCRQEMKKKPYQGVLIDHCATCKSVWLDHGELEKLAAGEDAPMSDLRQQAGTELREEAGRVMTILSACPKCQVGQIRERLIEGVKLDYCTKCRGLYFDYGELEEALANKQSGTFRRWQRRLFGK